MIVYSGPRRWFRSPANHSWRRFLFEKCHTGIHRFWFYDTGSMRSRLSRIRYQGYV